MAAHLNKCGIETELWFENQSRHASIIREIKSPQRHVESDLSVNPWRVLRRLSAYRRELRRDRPTVLHTHQTRACVIPLLAAWLESVPVRVYHNHGLPYLGYHNPMRFLLRSLELVNVRLATHVLLVSNSNLRAARKDRLLPPEKGHVIANGSVAGIDLAEFALKHFDEAAKSSARQKLGLKDARFVLAYVGRPVRRKGFQLLLRAWKRSGLGAMGAELLMAGCTSAECDAALDVPVPGVRGQGYLTDLREFYAASDAVTLPSDHEGFPYALLEGAAAGRALLGTDIPGIQCAIQHDQTGLLVPPRDEYSLCNAIELLASNREMRSQFGANARSRVEREFSREFVLKSLHNFYLNELRFETNPRSMTR